MAGSLTNPSARLATVIPSWHAATLRFRSVDRVEQRRGPGHALVHQFLDPRAADRDEGELGGDEEPVDRDEQREWRPGRRSTGVVSGGGVGASARSRNTVYSADEPEPRTGNCTDGLSPNVAGCS